jgi:HEAT repeat protein
VVGTLRNTIDFVEIKRASKEASLHAGRSANQGTSAAPARGFDEQLAQIEQLRASIDLRSAPDPPTVAYLRKTLANRSNFLVSKAAALTADLASHASIAALLPDVLTAFDRFFTDPVKTDPQCWAKAALARTLVKLEHRQKDAYLRGMRHHQMEPVWGGESDTAGALRATCMHALVDCPGISDADLLTLMLEPLTDADKAVRLDAARAIANIGGVSAVLLLRLRALLGNDEPEVLGATYAALLSLEGNAAIPLVARALKDGDDLAAEAAFALADLRSAEAFAALLARFEQRADPWFSAVLLSAMALTRQPAAVDYLIALIARNAREATAAIEALARISPSVELRARIEAAVDEADSMKLRQALRQHLPAPAE